MTNANAGCLRLILSALEKKTAKTEWEKGWEWILIKVVEEDRKWESIYSVIHKSLRDFRPLWYSSSYGHAEGEHINRYRISPSFLCTRRHGVRAGFTARGRSWRNMAWTGNKKALYVLEFAKTESVVANSKTQNAFLFSAHARLLHKKTCREILYLLICSPSAWPSRLIYRRGRKSRRDLWITLYIICCPQEQH
jgi:hypothetical protein